MVSLTRPTTPPLWNSILFLALISPRPPRVAEFPERALFPAFDFIAATTTAQYSSPLGSAPPLNNTSKLSLREREEGREKERGWNLAWRESEKTPVVHFRAWLFEGKYFYVRRGGILDAFLIPSSWIRKRVYVIRAMKFSDACLFDGGRKKCERGARDRWRGRCSFFFRLTRRFHF